jgi:hypothetical protein
MKYPPFAIITHKDPALNEAVQTLCFAKKIFWNSGNQEKVRIDPDMAIISNCADRKTATPFIFFNDGYEVLLTRSHRTSSDSPDSSHSWQQDRRSRSRSRSGANGPQTKFLSVRR